MTWYGNNLLTFYFNGIKMAPPINQGEKMRVDRKMTWLDSAAIAIAAGMLSSDEFARSGKYEIARWSYDMAEAMLEETIRREEV
jgi:hypothetical protein